MLLSIAKEVLGTIQVFKHVHRCWAEIRSTLQALPNVVHAMVNVISLSCVPCVLVLLVLCTSSMILFCLSTDMAVIMCTVVVFVELFPHSVETVQVVEDIERKVVFARYRMLILLQVIREKRIQGHLLWCDGRILVLEKLSPCSIYGGARSAKVEWNAGVHLAIYTVACFIEEEKIIKSDCGKFVWQGGCGYYSRWTFSIVAFNLVSS